MITPQTLETLKAADPDRCRGAVFADKDAREQLMLLYAFHYELSKVPEIVSEPMFGDIRYQWWRDVVEEIYSGKPVRKHEVTTPLSRLFKDTDMPRYWAERLIDARARDLDPTPFSDLSVARDYARQTSGVLMQMGVKVLGFEPGDAVMKAGEAWGLTGLARAWPYYHKGMLSELDFAQLCGAALSAHQEAKLALADLSPNAFPAIAYAAMIPHYIKRLTHLGHNPAESLVQYHPLAKRLHLLGAVMRGKI